MNRRNFIKNIGLGATAIAVGVPASVGVAKDLSGIPIFPNYLYILDKNVNLLCKLKKLPLLEGNGYQGEFICEGQPYYISNNPHISNSGYSHEILEGPRNYWKGLKLAIYNVRYKEIHELIS